MLLIQKNKSHHLVIFANFLHDTLCKLLRKQRGFRDGEFPSYQNVTFLQVGVVSLFVLVSSLWNLAKYLAHSGLFTSVCQFF